MSKKANSNSFVKVYLNVMDEILEETHDAVCLTVYIAILRHRNTGTNQCFPSIQRIADIVGVSPSTVKRKVQKLYETGFLIINTGTMNTANNYYFPQENFYEEWDNDLDQLRAYRRKKAFKNKKEEDTTSPECDNDIEEDSESDPY